MKGRKARQIDQQLASDLDRDPIDKIEEVLSKKPSSALIAARKEYKISVKAHNVKKYQALAIMTAAARKLQRDPAERSKFLAFKFWKGKNMDGKNLPRLIARYMYGSRKTKGPLYEQARSHGHIIEHYLKTEMSCREIFSELQKRKIGGMRAAIDTEVAGDSSDALEEQNAGHSASGEVPVTSDTQGEEQERQEADRWGSGSVELEKERVSRPRFDPKRDLAIAAENYLLPILCIAEDEEALLKVRCVEDNGQWKQSIVVHFTQIKYTRK